MADENPFVTTDVVKMVLETDLELLDKFLTAHSFINSYESLYQMQTVRHPVVWFIRLARASIDLTMGTNPVIGTALCQALLPLLEEPNLTDLFDDPAMPDQLCIQLKGSATYGLFRQGKLMDSIAFGESVRATASHNIDSPAYWTLNIVLVNAYFHTLHFAEALDLFERIEPIGDDKMFLFTSVKQQIERLRYPYDSLPDTRPRSIRSLEIWQQSLGPQQEILQVFEDASKASTPKEQFVRVVAPKIAACRDRLTAIEALLDCAETYDAVEEEISRLNIAFQADMIDLMRHNQAPSDTMDGVTAALNKACFLLSTPSSQTLPTDTFCEVIEDLDNAILACKKFRNGWDRLNILWARALLVAGHFDDKTALCDFKSAFAYLETIVAKQKHRHIRAALPLKIPNLIPRLLNAACDVHDHDCVLAVSEFRRSLNISYRNENKRRYRGDKLSARKKGLKNRHFFSLSAPFYGDQIFAHLRTADGFVASSKCDLSISTVRALVPYVNPKNWVKMKLYDPQATPPDQALTPLLALIEDALAKGHITPEDHIDLALDYPVNLMPFSYVQLNETSKRLLELFTLSRVTGYAEWKHLALIDSPNNTFRSTVSIFCPAADESWREEKKTAFREAVQPLINFKTHENLDGGEADFAGVMNQLKPHSIIHFHTHGHFPTDQELNPLDHSGLLLANYGELTRRGHRLGGTKDPALLTPNKVLNSKVDLTGSHVTLCACVSGLSREAQSGDLVGLEFALREMGTSSILATHWHVDFRHASQLTSLFYKYWLQSDITKAGALRLAILDCAAKESMDVAKAHWFSFDLFEGCRKRTVTGMLLKKVALTDDFKATRLVGILETMLAETEPVWRDLHAATENEFKETLPLDNVIGLLRDHGASLLADADAVTTARLLLVLFAEEDTLAPMLSAAFERYEGDDTEMVASIIVTTGAVVALLMLVAATEFEIKGRNWSIRKGAVSAEQIKAIKDLLPKLPTSGTD